jgi:hypothetical protein
MPDASAFQFNSPYPQHAQNYSSGSAPISYPSPTSTSSTSTPSSPAYSRASTAFEYAYTIPAYAPASNAQSKNSHHEQEMDFSSQQQGLAVPTFGEDMQGYGHGFGMGLQNRSFTHLDNMFDISNYNGEEEMVMDSHDQGHLSAGAGNAQAWKRYSF